MERASFRAPWSRLLRVMTAAGMVVILGCAAISLFAPGVPAWARAALVVALPSLVAGCALFTVRGYELEPGELRVRRLLWTTVIPLAGLRSVDVDPQALRGAIRTCGNGGLFVFAGWYWSKRLRSFRLYATDPKCAVVLALESRRIVVTPESPEEFAAAARSMGLGSQAPSP
jgi:hypothetical protein